MKTYSRREGKEMSGQGHPDDKDVVDGLRRGDRRSADDLVLKYQNELLAYLEHGREVPRDQAEEILQDVFFDIARKPERIRPGTDRLRPLLYAACKSRATDWYRKRKREADAFAEVVNELLMEGEISDPYIESPAAFPEPHIVLVRQSLSGLDRRDRVILTMRADRIPYAEIVKFLQESEGALRQRHKRALKEVRERYMSQLDSKPPDVQAKIRKKLKLD